MSSSKMSPFLPSLAGIGLLAAVASTAIARDGDPDRSFGKNGSVFHSVPGGLSVENEAIDVKVLAQWQAALFGNRGTPARRRHRHRRHALNANCSIDTSFGVAGARVVGSTRVGVTTPTSCAAWRSSRTDASSRWRCRCAISGLDMAVVRLNAAVARHRLWHGGKTTWPSTRRNSERRGDAAFKLIVRPTAVSCSGWCHHGSGIRNDGHRAIDGGRRPRHRI